MAAKKSGSQNQTGGVQDFTLISNFTDGYRNREDVTVLPPGVMVAGSQNILTNTHERIGIRKGFTLDGQANTDLAPIASSFDWATNGGLERNMRSGFLTAAGNDGKLQFRSFDADGNVVWTDLLTGLTSVNFNYTTFWDTTQLQTVMMAVNGNQNIYQWNGFSTNMLSATNTTGIIGFVQTPPNPTVSQPILVGSGGVDYVVGDVLTITGGSGTAQMTVTAVQAGAIKTSNVHSGGAGTGYVIGDTFEIDSIGTANYAHFTVLTVGGSGEVLTYKMVNNGFGYHTATNVPTVTSSVLGAGLTLDITAVGNGILNWAFISDADHGSGYALADLVPMTGGSGTNALCSIQEIMSGTLTKTGTETWAQTGIAVGLFNGGKFQLLINGTTYTYGVVFGTTLGDTTTLYGVTPDPSAIPTGSVILQAPVIYVNNNSTTGLPTAFNNDLIATLQQRLYIGSLTDSRIWVSAINLNNGSGHFDPLNAWGAFFVGFYGSPFQFLTTSPPTAFIPQEQYIYISAGKDEWYNVELDVDLNSADLTTSPPVQPVNSLTITRLNTTSQQASQSQAATSKIANDIVYLSFEPIINTFGRTPDILSNDIPQITDLSFPIVNDMNGYDFTNAAVMYYRKFVYIAVPREGLVLVYNMTDVNNSYWEAPQVLPISRFSVIDGELYGHSSQVSETYKLFTGTNDNGFPILARANFSFNQYGTRSQSKGYNEFYVEGYISDSTTLTLGVQYDIDGCATKTHFDIVGSDTQIVCISSDSASLGKVSLGKNPLGGELLGALDGNTPKFRVIKTFPIRYFYEDQISFSSEGINEQWEILAFGPQLQAFTDLNSSITQ